MTGTELDVFLTMIGSVVSAILGMFTTVLTLFTTTPILVFGLGISITGVVVARSKGLLRFSKR